MKKGIILSLLAGLIVSFGFTGFAATVKAPAKPAAAPKVYKVGEKGPAGGFIILDKGSVSDGWRYLEAAPADLSAGAEWGCAGIATGAAGTAVGTGKSNTQAIIPKCGPAKTAAKLCTTYRGGGKSDWFLPSQEELLLICTTLYKTSAKMSNTRSYWTSSESDANNAVFFFVGKGMFVPEPKNAKYAVRAIRAF